MLEPSRIARWALCATVAALGCRDASEERAADPDAGTWPTAPPLFDDFEAGELAPFWAPGDYGSGRFEPGAIEVVRGEARRGERSVRVTVRPGDVAQRGSDGEATERAELDSGKGPLLGRDVWTGYAFRVPADFPVVDVRLCFSQWKQEGQGSPLVAQRYRDGRHYLTIRRPGRSTLEVDLPRLEHGRWHDMVVRIRVSTSERDGRVEAWMDGELVVSHRGATAFAAGEDRFYHKVGLYRDHWPVPMTISFDAYARGGSFADVDPARLDAR